MPTRAQLALIHIAKKELHLNDEIYRYILFNLFKKNSARDLTREEVSRLISHFNTLGWKPSFDWANSDRQPSSKGSGFESFGLRNGMATPAQLRKIVAMWMTGKGVHQKTILSLRHFLHNRFHVSDLRFVKAGQVTAILAAIRRISTM